MTDNSCNSNVHADQFFKLLPSEDALPVKPPASSIWDLIPFYSSKDESKVLRREGRVYSSEEYKENEEECGLQDETKRTVFPSGWSKSIDDYDEQWDQKKMLPYLLKDKEPRWRYQIIGTNSPRYNILRLVIKMYLLGLKFI